MLPVLASAFGHAAGICVALTFLTAAAGKLRHRREIRAVIANYRLLPRSAVRPVAWALPWVEGGLALMLLVGGTAGRVAAWPAIALLVAFAWAMHVNLRRGRSHIDCGCGLGGLRQPLRHAFVQRNLALAAALLPLGVLPATLALAERAAATAAGAGAFGLLLLLTSLQALSSPHNAHA